jgi:hypothetical protein
MKGIVFREKTWHPEILLARHHMTSGCRDVVADKLPEGSDLERKFAKSSL